jgi:histidinol-phosphate aminotransferase
MDGAALAFVCNPVNPTGSVLAPGDVERLIDRAEETGCVLALDEAYMDFADKAYDVALAAVRGGRRLLVLRTFSKAWGLASVRLGCAVGAPDLIASITATSAALPFNVSRPAQQAVLQALRKPEHLDRVRQSNAEVRALLCKSLESLGIDYTPSATNFVMARIDGSEAVAAELASRHHILVRDLSALGLPGHIRISVGTPAEMERLAAALAEVLR